MALRHFWFSNLHQTWAEEVWHKNHAKAVISSQDSFRMKNSMANL